MSNSKAQEDIKNWIVSICLLLSLSGCMSAYQKRAFEIEKENQALDTRDDVRAMRKYWDKL